MDRRRSFVMIAFAALLAGAAALVSAQNEIDNSPLAAADQMVTTATAAPGQAPKVLYDFNALPDPVKRMLEQVVVAAESGEIETMRPVLESNELKPMVAAAHVEDPLEFWKKACAGCGGPA